MPLTPPTDLDSLLDQTRTRAFDRLRVYDRRLVPQFELHGTDAKVELVLQSPGIGDVTEVRDLLIHHAMTLGQWAAVGRLVGASMSARAWTVDTTVEDEARAALDALGRGVLPAPSPALRDVLIVAAGVSEAPAPPRIVVTVYEVARDAGTLSLHPVDATFFRPEDTYLNELLLAYTVGYAVTGRETGHHQTHGHRPVD